MKKVLLASLCLALAGTAAAKLGFRADAGAGMWLPTMGAENKISTFDATDDLGLSADNGFYLQARFQHPIPFIPNVALRQTALSLTGKPDASELSGFNFAGVKVPAGATTIDMNLDLSNTDFTLFWGVPFVPVASIHFGANLKLLRGSVELGHASLSEPESEPFTLPLPMLYLGAEAPLFFVPGVDLEVGGHISALPLGDSRVLDYQLFTRAYLSLPTNLLAKVGVEAGWRAFELTLDGAQFDENLTSSLSTSGLYIGATGRF